MMYRRWSALLLLTSFLLFSGCSADKENVTTQRQNLDSDGDGEYDEDVAAFIARFPLKPSS